MKIKLTEDEEIIKIGSGPDDLNTQGIRCELCDNLLTNARVFKLDSRDSVHYTCDNSCKMGLINKLRMKNPEFKKYISDLAKKQAEDEYEIRRERMSNLNKKLWHDPEYQWYRDYKTQEFTEIVNCLWSDPDWIKYKSESTRKYNLDAIANGTHNFMDFKSRCYIECNSLITRFLHKEIAYIYECLNYYNTYKLGFTTEPDYRCYSFDDAEGFLSEIITLVKGPVPDIAKLECLLKLKYALRNQISMEVYDISQRSEIIDFIHDYVKSSTTITLCE